MTLTQQPFDRARYARCKQWNEHWQDHLLGHVYDDSPVRGGRHGVHVHVFLPAGGATPKLLSDILVEAYIKRDVVSFSYAEVPA